MTGERKLEGGCQCGAVRYEIVGEPVMAAICHCTMCRRANAAPAVAWAMFSDAQVTFGKARPKEYASSPEARRGFYAACGPGLIDITIGSLDDPEAIRPTLHYWHAEHLSWAEFADDLPRHKELPPFG